MKISDTGDATLSNEDVEIISVRTLISLHVHENITVMAVALGIMSAVVLRLAAAGKLETMPEDFIGILDAYVLDYAIVTAIKDHVNADGKTGVFTISRWLAIELAKREQRGIVDFYGTNVWLCQSHTDALEENPVLREIAREHMMPPPVSELVTRSDVKIVVPESESTVATAADIQSPAGDITKH